MARVTGRDPVSRRLMMDGITAITSDRTGGTTYQARWQWVDPSGKRIFGAKVCKTLDEAERHLLETMLAIRRGTYGPDDTTMLSDYGERWLARMAHTWASSTTASRRHTWAYRILPALGHLRLSNVTRARCQAFVDGLLAASLQPSTISGHHAGLHGLLASAVKDGLIARNPASGLIMPRQRHTPSTVWTLDQAQAFLAATAGTRHHLLWSLLLATGVRVGEALALTWADVDFDTGALHVRATIRRGAERGWSVGQGTKTGQDRTIPIPATLVTQLRSRQAEIRAASVVAIRPYVFAGASDRPISVNTVRTALDRATSAAGLPRITPHGFRHTAATLMIDQGTPPNVVQDILGHRHVAMTLERYSHVDMRMMRDAVERSSARIGDERATTSQPGEPRKRSSV